MSNGSNAIVRQILDVAHCLRGREVDLIDAKLALFLCLHELLVRQRAFSCATRLQPVTTLLGCDQSTLGRRCGGRSSRGASCAGGKFFGFAGIAK